MKYHTFMTLLVCMQPIIAVLLQQSKWDSITNEILILLLQLNKLCITVEAILQSIVHCIDFTIAVYNIQLLSMCILALTLFKINNG